MTKTAKTQLSERYAKQRLMRILTDMVAGDQLLSWSALAQDITVFRGVEFNRENLRRLRNGTLGPANVEIIIKYLEEKHDPHIRERLRPDAIFDEMARSARDYYLHVPIPNDVDDWNEQLLEGFSGVYFCSQKLSKESYLPSGLLRQRIEKQKFHTQRQGTTTVQAGTPLLENLVAHRSILFLQASQNGYFYAAELPLSCLLPNTVRTPCQRAYYEGVGIISANTIQVQLRDCLTRIPRTHSITISKKSASTYENPKGLALQVLKRADQIFEEWNQLTDEDLDSFRREFDLAMTSDFYLDGQATIPVLPLSKASTKVERILSQSLLYFEKPLDFMNDLDTHFFFSHVTGVDEIQKVVENPLIIGTLDEH